MVVRLDKINEKYGTHFTKMDKVLVQMENDYANQEKWQSYAKNNDWATFMLLFEKDFPNMAADRYIQTLTMSMMRMAIPNILSKMKSLPCFTEFMSAICRATRLE